jgi:hypothetical protein
LLHPGLKCISQIVTNYTTFGPLRKSIASITVVVPNILSWFEIGHDVSESLNQVFKV